MCVFGINFSEFAERKESENIMGGPVNVEVEISQTSRILNSLTYKSSVDDRIREINGYKNSVYHSQGIKMEARIEVQPQAWYRLTN